MSDLQSVVVALWAALSVLVVWYGSAMATIRAIQKRRAPRSPGLDGPLEYVPPPA